MKFHEEIDAQIEMRRASEENAEILFAWRNSDVAREFSRSGDLLSFESHLSWLRHKLRETSPDLIFVFYDNDLPMGMTRLDLISGGCYDISVIVDGKFSSKGNGKKLVIMTCDYAKRKLQASCVVAIIKETNNASIRLFSSLDFEFIQKDDRFVTYELRF